MFDISDPIDTILIFSIVYFLLKNITNEELNQTLSITIYFVIFYIIYKCICKDLYESFTNNRLPFDTANTQEKYKIVPLSNLLERPTMDQMKQWINSGYFLDDGNDGYSSPIHNKCSPLCCKKQKYIPNELQPDPNIDPELAINIHKYEPTNMTCIDLSNINDSLGNASCMCLPKEQTNFIHNSGYSPDFCNKK